MDIEVLSALSLGFLGSMHCIGMCGPIALVIPVNRSNRLRLISGSFSYNLGRVITYTFIGLVFGLIGESIALAGFQRGISVALGIIIIFSALLPGIISRYFNVIPIIAKLTNRLKQSLSVLFSKNSMPALFGIGLLNGFLPCGLVYVALAGAIVSGTMLAGATYMAFFGIGTIPVMFALPLLGKFISDSFRNKMMKLLPIVLILFGVLFILRGMNLGIPFISPII